MRLWRGLRDLGVANLGDLAALLPASDAHRAASEAVAVEGDGGTHWLLELRARFDRLNRGTDSALNERRFDTLTLGLTYRFNKQVRLMADYQFRDFEAPGLDGSDIPNQILDDTEDLFAVRLWATF